MEGKKPMDCDRFFDLLEDHPEPLTDAEKKAMDEHAEGCADCKRLIKGRDAVYKLMRNVPAEVEPDPATRAKVVAAAIADIEERQAKESQEQPKLRVLPPVRSRNWVAIAASVAIVAGASGFGAAALVFKGWGRPSVDREYQEVARHELDLAESEKNTAHARHALDVLQQLHEPELNPGSTNPPSPGGLDTRVDQARAYFLLGNKDVARRMAESVLDNGSEEDRAAAKALLEKMGR